ncbi:hypothetical protein Tco_1304814 [Tanacetum coccineum]
MLHRLCRPSSIPLSFGLETVLPRRSVSCVSWAPALRRPRANTHRLRYGLPGYLILFAPHAFTPQRRVSWGFFLESCHDRVLDERALQAALSFFTHAILLDRAFTHCPRFPTTAPRGSPGRVSVLVWLIIRKDQLSIIGLLPENNVRLACVKHIASVPSEPGSNSSFDYDLALQCLVIDILEKLVKSRQTLSKAMVARNGFSQVIDSPYGRLA